MTKCHCPKPQYKKCSPQPQNPNPQTHKSVAFHTFIHFIPWPIHQHWTIIPCTVIKGKQPVGKQWIQRVLGRKLIDESVARISGDHSPALFSSFWTRANYKFLKVLNHWHLHNISKCPTPTEKAALNKYQFLDFNHSAIATSAWLKGL